MSTGPKFDRADLRAVPRHINPVFEIIVECELFHSVDWSIGGVHLDGVCEGVAVGTAVDGWIGLPEARQAFAFSGQILRSDPATGNTVVRFDEIEAEVAGFLGHAVVSRLH